MEKSASFPSQFAFIFSATPGGILNRVQPNSRWQTWFLGGWEHGAIALLTREPDGCSDAGNSPAPPLHQLINLGGGVGGWVKSQLSSHIMQVCLFSSKQAAFRWKASLSLHETQIECSTRRMAPSCQPPAASDCIFTFINDLCEADVVILTLEMRTLKLTEVKWGVQDGEIGELQNLTLSPGLWPLPCCLPPALTWLTIRSWTC